jgi:2,4-dienoyl-CoA reductase (NADPH2)
MASNRINDPFVAEGILRSGDADLVSLARQMFADPEFAKKVYEDKPEAINTCIACNQACLDRIFVQKSPSCLVNPRAVREIEFPAGKAAKPRKIAVIGGGPAGMTFSFNAAERGHAVTLFEAGPELGGQLLLAKAVPDKIEFDETLRYFNYRIKDEGVEVRTNTRATIDRLAGFDHVVIATGVKPRTPEIKGIDGPNVVSYADLLSGKARVGRRVAIIGAGGIGFDAAEFLLDHPRRQPSESEFRREYGVAAEAGGLTFLGRPQAEHRKDREITIMQRSDERIGDKLSITIGWIKRDRLLRAGVKFRAGLQYRQIIEKGVEIETAEGIQLVEADTVVVCAGQESEKDLYHDLRAREIPCSIIGGAHVAAEVDALRAIDEATRLAMEL